MRYHIGCDLIWTNGKHLPGAKRYCSTGHPIWMCNMWGRTSKYWTHSNNDSKNKGRDTDRIRIFYIRKKEFWELNHIGITNNEPKNDQFVNRNKETIERKTRKIISQSLQARGSQIWFMHLDNIKNVELPAELIE